MLVLPDAGATWAAAGVSASIETLIGPRPAAGGAGNLVAVLSGGERRVYPAVHAEWNGLFKGRLASGPMLADWTSGAPAQGAAVLLRRGGTSGNETFAALASKAASAGAVLVIIVNNGRPEPQELCLMSDASAPEAPTVLVTEAAAKELRFAELAELRCRGTAGDVGVPLAARALAFAPRTGALFLADMTAHCIWQAPLTAAPGARAGRPVVIAGTFGTQGESGMGDGPALAAMLEYPMDLALVEDETVLFVCEIYAVRALELTAEPAPELRTVFRSSLGLGGIAVAPSGRLFVSEHSQHQISEVCLATGVVTAVVGTGIPGPLRSDVAARLAPVSNPTRLVAAPGGELLFVDAGNKAIRRVDGSTGLLGTLSEAADCPEGLTLGPGGCLLASEGRAHQVFCFRRPRGREWDWDWSAVAGSGCKGHCGEGGPALEAELDRPQGVLWAPPVGLLICDTRNFSVRVVRPVTPWVWLGPFVLLRALLAAGRAALLPLRAEAGQVGGGFRGMLWVLLHLPDDEFRRVLLWCSMQ